MAEKLTLLVHSGDFDKLYCALIVANGGLAMGLDVSMYFTFYGLKRLKAGGLEQGPVSEPDVTGAGKTQMLERMGAENMAPIGQLLEAYRDLGGKVYACEATLAAVGLTKGDLNQEWIDGFAGVVQLIEEMKASSSTLFI